MKCKVSLAIVLCVCFLAPVLAQVPGLWFDRVFIVVMENQAYEDCIENEDLIELATRGRLLTNYFGITHPSQPNYLAMTSGATWTDENDHVDVAGSNIVDLLEAKGISWKSYQEGYPGNCWDDDNEDEQYYRKHNPFISYDNVRENATRCAKIVPATQLATDISGNTVPQFAFYTPDQDNDGHDTGLDFGATWVSNFLEARLDNANFRSEETLIVVTYDEDDSSHDNHIYTLLIGDMVTAGEQDARLMDHYTLLRTIEDNWNLGNLGRGDLTAQRTFFTMSTTGAADEGSDGDGNNGDGAASPLFGHSWLGQLAAWMN